MSNIKNVIVVGAGPVGLLTALMLSKRGIKVQVVEREADVNRSPRGLAYGPSAVRTLRQAGVLEKILLEGWVMKTAAYRNIKGDILAERNLTEPLEEPDDFSAALDCGSLAALLAEELKTSCSNVDILWSHNVTDVEQSENNASVDVAYGDGQSKRSTADFIIGADGGTSTVRHLVFGRNFPGYTWPTQLVAINIHYDLSKFGWSDCQWVIDEQDWFLGCRINQSSSLWRVCYPADLNATEEEIRADLPNKLKRILPGSPEPPYDIPRLTPYHVHQRLAARMRDGRVLLAGDAAHLTNPMGGRGLTTGIADVGSLVDCLVGIHEGKASVAILDKYDQVRREIFTKYTDAPSTANFKRMSQNAGEVARNDPMIALLNRAKTDPEAKKELDAFDRVIAADMTVYYDKV